MATDSTLINNVPTASPSAYKLSSESSDEQVVTASAKSVNEVSEPLNSLKSELVAKLLKPEIF